MQIDETERPPLKQNPTRTGLLSNIQNTTTTDIERKFQGNFLWKFPWNFLWKFPGNFPGSFMLNLTTWKLPIEEIVNYQISLKNNTQFLHIPVFKTQFLNLLVFLKLSETLWNLVKLCETLSWNFLWKLHTISKSWKLSIYYPPASLARSVLKACFETTSKAKCP